MRQAQACREVRAAVVKPSGGGARGVSGPVLQHPAPARIMSLHTCLLRFVGTHPPTHAARASLCARPRSGVGAPGVAQVLSPEH